MAEKFKVKWINPNKARPPYLFILHWRKNAGEKLSKSENRRLTYYERLYLSTPKWETRQGLAVVYKQAKEMRNRGQKVEVDHIYPLNGVDICGLHVVDNLRIISTEVNQLKSNAYYPGMPNEQYNLFGCIETEKQIEFNI